MQLYYYSLKIFTYTSIAEQKKKLANKYYIKQRNYSAASHLASSSQIFVVLFCEIYCTLCDAYTLPKTTAFSNVLRICFPSKPHLLMSSLRFEEFHFAEQLTIGLLTDYWYANCFRKVFFQFGEALDDV